MSLSRPCRRSTGWPRARRWVRWIGSLFLLGAMVWAVWSWPDQSYDPVTPPAGASVRALDGDSFDIGTGDQRQRIRLDGIDAPERNQLCTRADGAPWPCGMTAHAALTEMLLAPGLRCDARAQDRYQRRVARCRTDRVADLAAEMVLQGHAVATGRADDPRYGVEEERARMARRGLWQGRFERPADWRASHPR